MTIVFIPLPAFAEGDTENVIQNLGRIAILCGIAANLPFVLLNKYRHYVVSSGGQSLLLARKLSIVFKPVLNFHIMMNSIGYFAGMIHGQALSIHLIQYHCHWL